MSNDTCTIGGCERPVRVKSRGWCAMHYVKWQRHGDPEGGRSYGTNPATCTVDDCERPYAAGGYCNMHYLRSRHGKPMDAPAREIYRDADESFDARTEREGDCLVWTGARNAHGYGIQTSGGSRTSKPGLAHRWAWERENGTVPDGMEIDHICWNPACVSLDHLRLATSSENGANRNGAYATSATRVRNVYRKRDKFRVQIVKGRKMHYFGVYATIEEATRVAERERARLFGEFAGR